MQGQYQCKQHSQCRACHVSPPAVAGQPQEGCTRTGAGTMRSPAAPRLNRPTPLRSTTLPPPPPDLVHVLPLGVPLERLGGGARDGQALQAGAVWAGRK